MCSSIVCFCPAKIETETKSHRQDVVSSLAIYLEEVRREGGIKTNQNLKIYSTRNFLG